MDCFVASLLAMTVGNQAWPYDLLVSVSDCAFLDDRRCRSRGVPPKLRESAMVSTILIVILVVALMVGLSGRLGGYGFGHGHSGMGLIGVILVVLVVLKLLRKI
jgi:uncharacterized protein DUF3309